MKYFQFVQWEPCPIEHALSSTGPRALQAWDNGDKKPLQDMHIATTDPCWRIGGWYFSLTPYLRRYWVKTKYYGIQEYYALCKTDIRRELKSACLEIVEV